MFLKRTTISFALTPGLNRLTCSTVISYPPKCSTFLHTTNTSLNPEIQLPGAIDLSPKSKVDLADSEDHYRAGSKGGSGPYLELDTPEYAVKVRSELVVEKLIAQGGIRLVGVLNWWFADLWCQLTLVSPQTTCSQTISCDGSRGLSFVDYYLTPKFSDYSLCLLTNIQHWLFSSLSKWTLLLINSQNHLAKT